MLSAARRLLEEKSCEKLVFHAPGHDLEIIYQARKAGLGLERETLVGHTFKIVNFERLMERLSPYMEARVGPGNGGQLSFQQHGEEFHFRCGTEHVVLGPGDSERMILGPHSDLETNIPQIFQSIFPIPFPWPGLDSF